MNKIIKLIVLLFIPFSGFSQEDIEKKIQVISNDLVSTISKYDNKKIGVSDFANNQGKVCELGQLMAEELSVLLSQSTQKGNCEIIDRSHLKLILKEHDLNTEGFIDSKTAKELGKIKALDIIITGNISEFGDFLKISVKAIDTETAVILASTRIKISKTEAVIKLYSECLLDSNSASPSQSEEQKKPGEQINKYH